MPKHAEQLNNPAAEALRAVDDEELDGVVGGYDVLFPENGAGRDSWFVSLMIRRMIQDAIRRGLASPAHAAPEEVRVGDRLFRIRPVGENYYVEEIRG